MLTLLVDRTGIEDAEVEDVIMGKLLPLAKQTVNLAIWPEWAAKHPHALKPPQPFVKVSDMPGLAKLLLEPSNERAKGTHAVQPVLLLAGPGAGKTWAVRLLLNLLAGKLLADVKKGGVQLLPLLVSVQVLIVHEITC